MAMPHKRLTLGNRNAVANQIATYLGALATFNTRNINSLGAHHKEASPCELSDDFPFRTVTLAEVLSQPSGLKHFIEQTEMWLHLVRVGDSFTSYALSREDAFQHSKPELVSLCTGPLADKIDRVSRWLDEHETDEAVRVTLLSFPAHHTFAFGISIGQQTFAVLIDQPVDFTKLKFERMYPLEEFLKLLAQETNSGGTNF